MRTQSPQGEGPACPACGMTLEDAASPCPNCARTVAPPEQAPSGARSGPKEIAGFEIVREMGAGGMGTVYEAIDRKMNRRVALKGMSRHHSSTDKAEARFAREAWIGGKLNHPNLVRVFERGTWEDLSFFSMELVDGGSLDDVVQRMRQGKKDDQWGLEYGSREYIIWVINQIIQAARGLDYAHRQGVVHRDVKPMNILMTRDPCVVKIADFGLAAEVDATRLTTMGKGFGTVAYMAPEQIRGEMEDLDPRTDVYALGVTLFELLTLELPFKGATQQMYLTAVLTHEARKPSKLNARVGRDLEVVLGKALEKDLKDRYPSAAEFADDLERVLDFRPIAARPPTRLARIGKWIHRKPWQTAVISILCIGLPVTAAIFVRNYRSQQELAQVGLERLWDEARRYERMERYEDELDPLDKILEEDTGNVEALHARSVAWFSLAQRERDVRLRAELRANALSDVGRAIDLLPDEAWPYRVRAFFNAGFGRSKEAAEDEREAESRRKAEKSFQEIDIEGKLALASGEPEKAARLFTQLLDRKPGSVQALYDRAMAHSRSDQIDKAIIDYGTAAGLSTEDFYPHFRLGDLLTLRGDLEEAEAEYRKALGKGGDLAPVHANLADNLVRQGYENVNEGESEAALERFTAAEQSARRSLELDPGMLRPGLTLGASLMEQYRHAGTPDPEVARAAVEQYDRVIEATRDGEAGEAADIHVAALSNLCDALIQMGRLERALPTCGAVTEKAPDDPVGFYNLAGVHALLGRTEEALSALEKDLELGDTDHEYLASDDWFAAMRQDARFKSLLERMKQAASGQ